jgi:hypothetical protein
MLCERSVRLDLQPDELKSTTRPDKKLTVEIPNRSNSQSRIVVALKLRRAAIFSFVKEEAAMNASCTSPANSLLFSSLRCAGIAFVALATIVTPIFSPTATAVPQPSTLAALTK